MLACCQQLPRGRSMAHRTTLETRAAEIGVANAHAGPTPPRYRPPGDVLRLIAGGLVLVPAVVVLTVFPERLIGPSAHVFTSLGPDTTAGRLVVGLLQIVTVAVAIAVV